MNISSEFSLSEKLRISKMDSLLLFIDTKSLHASAIADCGAFYPKIESVFAFTKIMKDDLLDSFLTKVLHI